MAYPKDGVSLFVARVLILVSLAGMKKGAIGQITAGSIVMWGLIVSLVVMAGLMSVWLETQRQVYLSVTISPNSAIFPLLLAYSVGLLVCVIRSSPKDRFELFSVGFWIRIIMGFMLSYVYQAQDEQILHTKAEELANGIESTIGRPDGYTRVLSALYFIFGPNLLIPKVVNSLLGSILPFLLYDITRHLSPNPRVARVVLYFCLFFPPLLFYSSMNLKELPCAFLLALTVWGLFVPRWPYALRLAFGLLVSITTYYLRGAWALFPGLTTLVYAVLEQPRSFQAIGKLLVRKAPLIIALLLILAFPLRSVVEGVLAHLNYRLFIGTHAEFGTLRTTEGSFTRALLDVERPWSVRNIAIQILRAPFSPSPIAFLFEPSVQAFIDSLNGLTQYLLIPFAITGLVTNWRRSEVLTLGLLHLSMLVTIGLSLMLGLTIQRHSVPQFVVLYVLAGLGTRAPHRYWWIFSGWIVLVMLHMMIYVYARLTMT